MSIGKPVKSVNLENFVSMPGTAESLLNPSRDPVRSVTLKYWSNLKKRKDLYFVNPGFEAGYVTGDSGETGLGTPGRMETTLTYSQLVPFSMEFSEPIVNESPIDSNLYEICQDVYFIAEDYVSNDVWVSFVTQFLFPACGGTHSVPAAPGATAENCYSWDVSPDGILFAPGGKIYHDDYAFIADVAYSQAEAKKLNFSNAAIANVEPNYNFLIERYEGLFEKYMIDERVLPNMYAFMSEEVRLKELDSDISERSKKMLLNKTDYKDLIDLKGSIPTAYTRNTDKTIELSSVQYFDEYACHYPTAHAEHQDKLKKVANEYTYIGVPIEALDDIALYNSKAELFPMYAEIEFATDKTSQLSQILEDTKTSKPLMQAYMATEMTGKGESKRFIQQYDLIADHDTEASLSTRRTYVQRSAFMYDLESWYEKFNAGDITFSVDMLGSSVILGSALETYNSDTGGATLFKETMQSLVFLSKLRKLVKNCMRNYKEILSGDLCCTETVMYKIEKYIGNARLPTQTYYICNENESDIFNFIDTQVKYDQQYTYRISAIQLVVGSEYTYKNLSIEEDVAIKKMYAKATACVRPTATLIEIPFFSEKEIIMDNPPIAPDVDIIPYRGISNKLLFNLNGGIGEHYDIPVALSSKEDANIRALRIAQKIPAPEPIKYSNEEPTSQFEIYRLDKKPTSYDDFAGHKIATVATDISQLTIQKASSASYITTVTPNKTYYYMFRAIDYHGHISNPSAVYEVTMVTREEQANSNAVYPLISTVDFAVKEHPRAPEKPAKKFLHIVPKLSQVMLNEYKSGLLTGDSSSGFEKVSSAYDTSPSNMQLGIEKDSIWDKRFKIRFTSKKTGRKFDLNLTYKYQMASKTEERDKYACSQAEAAPSFDVDKLAAAHAITWREILAAAASGRVTTFE